MKRRTSPSRAAWSPLMWRANSCVSLVAPAAVPGLRVAVGIAISVGVMVLLCRFALQASDSLQIRVYYLLARDARPADGRSRRSRPSNRPLAQRFEQLARRPLARLHGALEKALMLDRRVLAGEVDRALREAR